MRKQLLTYLINRVKCHSGIIDPNLDNPYYSRLETAIVAAVNEHFNAHATKLQVHGECDVLSLDAADDGQLALEVKIKEDNWMHIDPCGLFVQKRNVECLIESQRIGYKMNFAAYFSVHDKELVIADVTKLRNGVYRTMKGKYGYYLDFKQWVPIKHDISDILIKYYIKHTSKSTI